jgi:SAM-dependent methyltransferase
MSCTAESPLMRTLQEVLRCPLCRATQLRTIVAAGAKSINQCLRCSVCFLFPQPSRAEVTKYFQSNEEEAPADNLKRDYEDGRRAVLAKVAADIQRRKRPGAILDVGCATGFFLNQFFGEWQRHAVELSPRKAELAALGGIQVRVGDISAASLPSASFDAVTFLDAFYYIRDPQSVLSEFRRVLKDDGILVLEMAWAGSYIWRRTGLVGKLFNEDALLESSDHLFDHTPRSVSLLLHNCGFIIEAIVTLPTNRQHRWFPDLLCRSYSWLSRLIAKFSAGRFCLGPRFMVIARKRSAVNGPISCEPAETL